MVVELDFTWYSCSKPHINNHCLTLTLGSCPPPYTLWNCPLPSSAAGCDPRQRLSPPGRVGCIHPSGLDCTPLGVLLHLPTWIFGGVHILSYVCVTQRGVWRKTGLPCKSCAHGLWVRGYHQQTSGAGHIPQNVPHMPQTSPRTECLDPVLQRGDTANQEYARTLLF